jgi:FtsP/CotA-like multicopper oxidase with cupredoxin domain
MSKLTRRTALGLAMAAPFARPSWAAAPVIDLRAVKRTLEVNGKAASVYGLVGPGGRPGLELKYGEPFRVKLSNELDVATLIHWHGLTPPAAQDGVPDLSQPVLPPGAAYDYDFPITRSGTHWMHSHVGLQEQQLLAAPLIVREVDQPMFEDVEHVVLLHDFTFRDPAEILAKLRAGGGGHAMHSSGGTVMEGTGNHGGMMMRGMAAMNDVTFDAFLANDRTLDDPEIVKVDAGMTLRLRIINAAAASNMWVDLGDLSGELVAVDGHAVVPVEGRIFPLAIAQRADIRIRVPAGAAAYPVLFRPEGLTARTGIVLMAGNIRLEKISAEGDLAPALDLALEAELRAVAKPREEPVTRTEMIMLTGGGSDYSWGFNGQAMMHESLLSVREGERVEVMFHNMTMMSHPMHLHGHYFKVVAVNGQRFDGAIRDTVLVPPMAAVTIRFDADNPGTWAFHCHHIYHMNAGMMGTLNYVNAA